MRERPAGAVAAEEADLRASLAARIAKIARQIRIEQTWARIKLGAVLIAAMAAKRLLLRAPTAVATEDELRLAVEGLLTKQD
jgi:hypothetical protein